MMRGRIAVLILLALCILAVAGIWLNQRTAQYDEIICQTAVRYGIDFYLVKAIIYEESWFRPDIRGASGELGLMQVTMGAATDFTSRNGFPSIGEAQVLEPHLNVEIGCWYLKQSLDRYRHSPDPVLFALLRYNAGEVRADNWLRISMTKPVPRGVPPQTHYLSLVDFPTTRDYVRRILKRFKSRNFWF